MRSDQCLKRDFEIGVMQEVAAKLADARDLPAFFGPFRPREGPPSGFLVDNTFCQSERRHRAAAQIRGMREGSRTLFRSG